MLEFLAAIKPLVAKHSNWCSYMEYGDAFCQVLWRAVSL